MKVMTIMGTRPEIIRLSRIIPLLVKVAFSLVVGRVSNLMGGLAPLLLERLL